MITDKEENKKIYSNFREYLLKSQISNSENFDKAILSLSSASLGISLAFIKDIVTLSNAHSKNLLKISWICFTIAIICTVLSYVTSQRSIKIQMEYAEKYYLDEKPEYLNKRNIWKNFTVIFNNFSALIFIIGIILTVWFVSINI